MAITIHQQPYEYTALKQKLIVVATSSNIGQPGFRYVVEIRVNDNPKTTFYVQPNINGALVFDLYPAVYSKMNLGVNTSDAANSLFGSYSVQSDDIARNIMTVETKIYEGYEVLGVFTRQATAYELDGSSLINAAFQISDGFAPDPNDYFALSSGTSYIMSDLVRSTYALDDLLNQYSLGANTIGIISFQDDYGVLTIPADDGTMLTDNAIDNVQVIQFNAAGAPIQTDTLACSIGAGLINHLPLMPANINEAFGLDGDWNHYIINFKKSGGSAAARSIAVFKADKTKYDECRFDKVRLAWTNSRGGWDYFNFTKRSEQSYSVERKRYRKVVGNYGRAENGEPFTFATYDRGLTERNPFVEKMLRIRTDFLTEGQFEYLKNLIYSESVYIIGDDGEATAVVIDNNNYTAIKTRSYAKTDLELTLKFSNDYTA
jgi:hypothetical protein